MGDRIDPVDVLADEGVRLSDWLGGLLVRGLSLPEGLSVDQHDREMACARAAVSGLAGEVLDPAGPGIVERIQAAQFVSAHAAAMDWQAEANRRDLPPHARATAQRIARQLMALTTSQLNGLCRLKAERRKERAEAARLAEQAARRAERETADRIKARAAETRAMIAGFEETLKAAAEADRAALAGLAADPDFDRGFDADFDPELDAALNQDLDAALDAAARAEPDLDEMAERALAPDAPLAPPKASPKGAPPGSEPPGAAAAVPPRQAKPEPVGAGVPEPPPDPAPSLNRQQRRAVERRRRKERRREGTG
jgi:hypothetical protein